VINIISWLNWSTGSNIRRDYTTERDTTTLLLKRVQVVQSTIDKPSITDRHCPSVERSISVPDQGHNASGSQLHVGGSQLFCADSLPISCVTSELKRKLVLYPSIWGLQSRHAGLFCASVVKMKYCPQEQVCLPATRRLK